MCTKKGEKKHTEILAVVVAYAGLEAVRRRRGGGHFLRTVPGTCNRKVGFSAEKVPVQRPYFVLGFGFRIRTLNTWTGK